ncbi:phospholipase D-like domain-containing protein [Natrialbaceae archaeon A-arb3/5]
MLARSGLLAIVLLIGLVAAPTAAQATANEPELDRTTAESVSSEFDCPPANGTSDTDDLTATATAEPRIVELYPNPTTHENVGEFVVLDVPAETSLENWTITDGHMTASFPDERVSGRIAASTDPAETKRLTDEVVLELEGTIRLAVDGDELELRNGTATVDAVAYDRAPVAERWYRTTDDIEPSTEIDSQSAEIGNSERKHADGRWFPRDATCAPVSRTELEEATVFVLPDTPDVPRETIESAEDRLLLAGYTITSQPVADALTAAADRGVDVAVLFESGPVGGTPAATEPVLETLEESDVDVRAIGGEGARYRYHHPKYAVVDEQVLVTSENWKPSGTGGESSRGWGVRLDDDELAADLAAVFRADFDGWDTQSGSAFRANATFVDEESGVSAEPDTEPFPTNHEPETLPVETVELLIAPDNAQDRIAELIAEADDEILLKQAAIDEDLSLLEDVLDAARRGVDVRILLDSTWYHEDENAAVAAELEQIAATEELSLSVTLVDDTDRFDKIHAKGVVIDRDVAVVGSANWNENAFQNNREVLVALHGDEPATYYAAVFEDDWDGDSDVWSLPIGLSATVVVALVGAALIGRRYVRFGDR